VDVKALVIDVDAAPEVVDVENTLETWQGMVGGDIELVGLKDLVGEGIVNEEGKIFNFAPNEFATRLANLYAGDWISGTLVIVGECDDDGNFTDVDDDTVATILWMHARRAA